MDKTKTFVTAVILYETNLLCLIVSPVLHESILCTHVLYSRSRIHSSVSKTKDRCVVLYCRYTFISLQRSEMEALVCSDSNSCAMYSYNSCWLAGWLTGRALYWRSVESELSGTHRAVTGLSFTLKKDWSLEARRLI